MRRSVARDAAVAEARGVGVLDKAMAVLEAIEAGAGTLGELVRATGLSRATAHRLALALEAHGLLGRGIEGTWRLGPLLIRLGSAAMTDVVLADALRLVSRPILEGLARSTGESAQLFVRDGDHRLCIEAAESDQELRTIVRVGASLPLTAGSAGKVLLAWASQDDVERLLANVERLTPNTITDPARFRRQLRLARKRGWAESVGEREAGVASVSAPVLDGRGAILAAVSVSGPIHRIGRSPGKAHALALLEAARRIEADMGFRPPE